MSRIRKTTLKSGIKVITEEMPDSESSSIGVWVRTGSRNETRRISGISHFIEHMLFKGTKKRTALDISREIESVGGVLNAFTSREYTAFYAKVLNKDLPKAIDLLSDIFLNSLFDQKEIEREKMVVLQEIKLVEDTPDDIIHDIFAERFWKGNPLGWPILGSKKTVGSFRRRDVLGYFGDHYRPGASFITVAGGASHKKIVELLAPSFGNAGGGKISARVKPPAASHGAHLIRKDLEQVHFCIGVPTPPQSHPDRYKVYLLNTILGGGMSSRLFQEIREKRGLAYSVYSYLNLCKDAGSLVVYAGTSRESFSEAASLVLEEFAKLRKGVGAGELKNAKSQLEGSMLLGLEASDNRMSKLARDEIYFGEVVPVKDIIRGIERVTVKEMTALALRVLDPGKVALTAIGKVSQKDLPTVLKH